MVDILTAFLTGFCFGLILSIPVGPVNLTIMNKAAQLGFLHACLIGFGASLMESIYCAIAFTGLASFFSTGIVKSVMEVASFLFLVILGIKFITAKSLPTAGPVEERIEKTIRPHSAFMVGFVSVLGNPGVLLFWIVLAGNFISHDWVLPNIRCKSACTLGVTLGTSLWFTGLSHMVSKGRGRLKDATILRMERGSGLALLLLGLYYGGKIAIELAHATHLH